jgi:hypothetical protein
MQEATGSPPPDMSGLFNTSTHTTTIIIIITTTNSRQPRNACTPINYMRL